MGHDRYWAKADRLLLRVYGLIRTGAARHLEVCLVANIVAETIQSDIYAHITAKD